MRAQAHSLALAAIVIAVAGCASEPAQPAGPRFATAEQVEFNFRGRRFILGDDPNIAIVRAPDWPADRTLRLPFWLGANVLVPGVLQPTEGDYYVISEAILVKPLDAAGEWLIEAGSSLVKKETVFITTKTHYRAAGKILPTIVQYTGSRKFTRGDGTTVEIPVLREVSLPMKWTLAGTVPTTYARFDLR